MESVRVELSQKRAVLVMAEIVREDTATEFFHVSDVKGSSASRPHYRCIILIQNFVKIAREDLRGEANIAVLVFKESMLRS